MYVCMSMYVYVCTCMYVCTMYVCVYVYMYTCNYDYREILMTASPNIKTPSMDVPLLPVHGAKEKGERLKKLFTSVLLGDVSSGWG